MSSPRRLDVPLAVAALASPPGPPSPLQLPVPLQPLAATPAWPGPADPIRGAPGPDLIRVAVNEIQVGPVPWLLGWLALCATGPESGAPLAVLDHLLASPRPWSGRRPEAASGSFGPASGGGDVVAWHATPTGWWQAGVHDVGAGALRGPLPVSGPAGGARPGPAGGLRPPSGSGRDRSAVVGARGGAWGLVVCGRGTIEPCVDPGGATSVGVAGSLDVTWTVPAAGSGPEGPAGGMRPPSGPGGGAGEPAWSARLRTAAGDPVRWWPGATGRGRLSGTVIVSATSPAGASGEMTLQASRRGARARGTWPGIGTASQLEITTGDDGLIVRSSRPPGAIPVGTRGPDAGAIACETVAEVPARAPWALRVRRTVARVGEQGSEVVFEVRPGPGLLGSWSDLSLHPPAAGAFRLAAGGALGIVHGWEESGPPPAGPGSRSW
jgi:hypothetical protein